MPIVAALQMTSTPDLSQNLAIAADLLAQAAAANAKLAVLPEMFAIMAEEGAHMGLAEEYLHGPIQDFLSTQAKKNNLWIVGGTIPIKSHLDVRSRAACIVYNEKGHTVARYDKIHLFDVSVVKHQEEYRESNTISPGDRLVVLETPIGKLGLAVCYDLRFPELFRALLDKGAEVIAVPAAFTAKTGSDHWEILTRCRAVENLYYAVYACQTGTHYANRMTYGHSRVVDPWGKILHQVDTKPGLICADIDLDYMKQLREDFPALIHRRLVSIGE